jgi:hypothetical protein
MSSKFFSAEEPRFTFQKEIQVSNRRNRQIEEMANFAMHVITHELRRD